MVLARSELAGGGHRYLGRGEPGRDRALPAVLRQHGPHG